MPASSPATGAANNRATMGFTLPIIAAAFCIATLTYGCVLWFILSNRAGAQPVAISPAVRAIILTIGVAGLVGSVLWTRMRLVPAAEGGAPSIGGDPTAGGGLAPGGGPATGGLPGGSSGYTSGAADSPAALLTFQRDVIIAMALAETAAIIGFVLGFLSASLTDYLYLGVPSLLVMAGVIVPVLFRFMKGA